MGANGQIMRWEDGNFHKCIFQLSEHCKSENFLRPWWETHMKINPNQYIEIWKNLSLRLMVKRCQRSSQVKFPSY